MKKKERLWMRGARDTLPSLLVIFDKTKKKQMNKGKKRRASLT